jgi:hypothetical protein
MADVHSQISETKQSKFLLLHNPALLPPLFPSLAVPGTSQLSLGSLATATTSHLPNLSSASTLLQSYAPGGKKTTTAVGEQRTATPQPIGEEPQGPDPRDVDRVLGELVALGGRWALFRRFVYGRISVGPAITRQVDQMCRLLTFNKEDEDEEEEAQAKSTPPEINGDHADEANDQTSTQTKKESDMEVLEKSGSQRAIENLLKVYYEPLELWFLRSSIEKVGRIAQKPRPLHPAHHLNSRMLDAFAHRIRLNVSTRPNCLPVHTSPPCSTTPFTSSSSSSSVSSLAARSRLSGQCASGYQTSSIAITRR